MNMFVITINIHATIHKKSRMFAYRVGALPLSGRRQAVRTASRKVSPKIQTNIKSKERLKVLKGNNEFK